ncbi:period circadian protein homolog 2, partial [Oryzias melastigma]|uniref:period circadian protein homolog 2 n=1 Tax=Oryzias melastigma TaxID=30732 RepID=UPI000CF7D190
MEDAPVVLAPPPPPPPPRILTPSTVTTSTFTSVPPASTAVTPSVPTSQTVQPERESWRGGGGGGGGGSRFGLTKEVLSAHTQQEEQAFLDRFKDLSKLRVFDQTASLAARCHVPAALPRGVRCSRDYPAAGGGSAHRRGRGGKRLKHQESSEPHAPPGARGNRQDNRVGAAPMSISMGVGAAANSSSWPSAGSQASMP